MNECIGWGVEIGYVALTVVRKEDLTVYQIFKK